MMKKYRHILYVLTTLCLLVSLTSVALAAASMIIDNETISYIRIEGTADGITPGNNSYQIKATDSKPAFQAVQRVTRTLTFTNDWPGFVELTYSIDGNGTLRTGDNCTFADGSTGSTTNSSGTLIMQSGGKFTVSVTSPGTTTSALSKKSIICTFSPTAIVLETLSPTITFASSANGTYTVKDAAEKSVNIGDSANSESYTLTPGTADPGYKFLCFVFTPDDTTAAKSSFGLNATGAVTFGDLSVPGTVTCKFMPTDSAMYTVDGVYYAYLDEAITAASGDGSKKIVVVGSGKVCGSTGQSEFTIPSTVTMVLPYAAGQDSVQGSSLSSNSYYPYGNYAQGTGAESQPGSLASTNVELTIPSGTTVKNNGIISVGGTLDGHAVMSGAHSNLKVDGTLELKSSTSVLSAIGYVYGSGSVVANGSGAKILQPLSLLRNNSWGWSVGNTGSSFSGLVAILNPGMNTYPSDGASGNNPSPRFSTQAIQCDFQMAYGDTMHGYADQYCNNHYRCTVTLIGSDGTNGIIVLKQGATLKSSYNSELTSATYANVGKMTLEITGDAIQGNIKLEQNGMGLSLNTWPFPVPYNYDIILKSGTFDLNFDLSLLPGAGLTVGSGATLNIPENVHLAVFTGAKDHSRWGSHADSIDPDVVTISYSKNNPASPRYPDNSTLSGPSGGTMMANLVVDGGTLNIKSGAYFGGVVQTTGKAGGTIIMKGNTGRFTRQLGLTGQCNDMDADKWYFAGETIYEFYPQYFDAKGNLQTLTNGKTYYAASAETNAIEKFSFDLYYDSSDVSLMDTYSETINAAPKGRWSDAVAQNGTTKYDSLADAVVGYESGYIQMLAPSVAEATIDKAVLIDLNGKSVEGVTVAATDVRIMDATANGYGIPTGKLSVTSGIEKINLVSSYDNGTTIKHYVKIANKDTNGNPNGTYSFHRAGVSLTGIQHTIGTNYALFQGTFRGNATVAGALKRVGFQFSDIATDTWRPIGTAESVNTIHAFTYARPYFSGKISAGAMLDFGETPYAESLLRENIQLPTA